MLPCSSAPVACTAPAHCPGRGGSTRAALVPAPGAGGAGRSFPPPERASLLRACVCTLVRACVRACVPSARRAPRPRPRPPPLSLHRVERPPPSARTPSKTLTRAPTGPRFFVKLEAGAALTLPAPVTSQGSPRQRCSAAEEHGEGGAGPEPRAAARAQIPR